MKKQSGLQNFLIAVIPTAVKKHKTVLMYFQNIVSNIASFMYKIMDLSTRRLFTLQLISNEIKVLTLY